MSLYDRIRHVSRILATISVESATDDTRSYGRATILFDATGDVVKLHSLRVPQKARKSGEGRKAMEAFIAEFGDRPIELLASPLDSKTSLAKLVQFYKSLGFEVSGRGNPAGDPMMTRPASS